jgi:predicted dehydrogenase/aryl-alcohol dehydrogenase-like predicted oxidoreductase
VAVRLRWGILGTGVIARTFVEELAESLHGRAVAVGSRQQESADRFARRFGLERAHGSYDALVEDDGIDAVYIATPHPEHARWAVRLAEAGRHILCEKPLTVHHGDAEAVVDAAAVNGVFLMEAFMYRCHPQTTRVLELLRSGVLGELRVIEAVHSFAGPPDPDGRLLNAELGGGGILDVGCYCMSGARLMAGVATGHAGAIDPLEVTGLAHIGRQSRVDEWAVASLRFPGDVLAHLATGVQVDQPPGLRLYGSDASLELRAPWLPGVGGRRQHQIAIRRPGTEIEIETVHSTRGMYAIEADEVAECIRRGAVESPAMPWADTLGNMAALDRWRRAVGLTYEAERPAALATPVRGAALRRPAGTIPSERMEGIERPVSRLVLGTMLALGDETWPTAMSVFDAFFEQGGNIFDSARRYGNGESDRALGQWMRTRGVRDQTVVIAKGAHTPRCNPDALTRELFQSLEDLQTEWADLYFLHRDNPQVPVGEFVDVLNEHLRAGRLRAFGGSNWTMARIDAANEYARQHGLVGFTALSNQYSLARMVRPTYPGCLAASGPEWREWLERSGLAVVAWSSQASGFFADNVDPKLEKAWRDEGNRERRVRAERLGQEFGVPATTIALAWVLGQRLPIFPVIGPRTLAELRSSLRAVEVELDAGQMDWLDLRTE